MIPTRCVESLAKHCGYAISTPMTGTDLRRGPLAREDCEAACYDCLMSYSNQLDHALLDRQAILPILLRLADRPGRLGSGRRDARGAHGAVAPARRLRPRTRLATQPRRLRPPACRRAPRSWSSGRAPARTSSTPTTTLPSTLTDPSTITPIVSDATPSKQSGLKTWVIR